MPEVMLESMVHLVKVGVRQGSILSTLLFIMVLQALLGEFRSGCPQELLYADDCADCREMGKRYGDQGIWINMKKTKIMVSDCDTGSVRNSGR